MNNFSYCSPTKYIFGQDVENRAGEMLREMSATRVLVVYGQGSAIRSGVLGRVLKSIDDAGIAYFELGGIRPNPLDGPVYKGIETVRNNNIDAVIAVGGGSPIDTAKAIAAGACYDGDFWDFYCGKAIVAKALPIGVVLTIPAAGSEGSGNSVITKADGMVKISIRTDFWLRPKFALLNPELTVTLPTFQTACGVADMMAHILERYFSPTESVEVTDRISEGLLRAIIIEAKAVMYDPQNYQARANIMWAGTLAHNGVCGCGRTEDWSSHAIEHEISALYGVTHGAGLAAVFPAWITFMANHRPEKCAQFGRRVFDINDIDDRSAALKAAECLRCFFADDMHLPVSFTSLGIENPDITELVRRLHLHKGQTIGAYFPLSAEHTAQIYNLMK